MHAAVVHTAHAAIIHAAHDAMIDTDKQAPTMITTMLAHPSQNNHLAAQRSYPYTPVVGSVPYSIVEHPWKSDTKLMLVSSHAEGRQNVMWLCARTQCMNHARCTTPAHTHAHLRACAHIAAHTSSREKPLVSTLYTTVVVKSSQS